MSVSNYTNNVMKALPASLRPNPHYIDEYVNKAVAKGWTPTKLAETSFMNRQGMNPALVATNIKNLSQHEPEAIKKAQYAPVSYPASPVPMPAWFKDALDKGGSSQDFEEALNKRHPRLDTKKLARLQAGKDALPLEDYLTHALDVHPQMSTPPIGHYPTTGVA